MASNDAKTLKAAIQTSISQYKEIIYKDLNTSIRIQDGDKLYTTRILKWDKEQITFDAPLYQRDWVLFAVRSTLEVTILTKSAIYMANVEIFDKSRKKDVLQYKSRIVSPIEKKQQRAHFRLGVLLPLEYTIIPDMVNQYGQDPDQTVYTGTTTNVSAGGLCMASKPKLAKDTALYMTLEFLDQKLELTGTTLLDGEALPNGLYTHRVQFDLLDAPTENLLTRLIFEKQRQMLSRPTEPLR